MPFRAYGVIVQGFYQLVFLMHVGGSIIIMEFSAAFSLRIAEF